MILGMRFAVIALLACQHDLAISLIYAAIPVVLRQNGAPLELIGLLGIVFFALTVNFLGRRSWLVAMLVASAVTIPAAAILDPGRDFVAVTAVRAARGRPAPAT